MGGGKKRRKEGEDGQPFTSRQKSHLSISSCAHTRRSLLREEGRDEEGKGREGVGRGGGEREKDERRRCTTTYQQTKVTAVQFLMCVHQVVFTEGLPKPDNMRPQQTPAAIFLAVWKFILRYACIRCVQVRKPVSKSFIHE